ncbi:hypothetical protein [Streptodolium elevatio]|uniref:Uncharacterized protein n=1 Tax=Streptodolium elevatio TaxID=3157996 RepID=A0ABV3DJE3_9ACTN
MSANYPDIAAMRSRDRAALFHRFAGLFAGLAASRPVILVLGAVGGR